MAKRLLIIDNDDQTDAIETIETIAKNKPFKIKAFQLNVGLPDGNDVIGADGKIDIGLVKEKYLREFDSMRFDLIAFDFKLHEESGTDGVSLIKLFNSFPKTTASKKILYSSEINEIISDYLEEYKMNNDFDMAWGRFKTLINLDILEFCKREDYEVKVVEHIARIPEKEDDYLVEELQAHKDLYFQSSLETYNGLNLGEIADRIRKADSLAIKFKKELLASAIAQLIELRDGKK